MKARIATGWTKRRLAETLGVLTEALRAGELAGHLWVIDVSRVRQYQPPDALVAGEEADPCGGSWSRYRLMSTAELAFTSAVWALVKSFATRPSRKVAGAW